MASPLTNPTSDIYALAASGVSMNRAEPSGDLSIDDITKLAAAGIKIDWNDVRHRIKPNDKEPEPSDSLGHHDKHLIRPLVQRWVNTETATAKRDYGRYEGMVRAFPFENLSAAVHGDKVYLFAHIEGTPPVVLEDEKHIYPSDGLMARLHLMIANLPKPEPRDEQGAAIMKAGTAIAPAPLERFTSYEVAKMIDAEKRKYNDMTAVMQKQLETYMQAVIDAGMTKIHPLETKDLSLRGRAQALADSWKPTT